MPYTNITGLFTGICDAIRYKGGAVGTINHQNIPSAILNIRGGGGTSCDIGFIYLDEDPFKPSGGGNNGNNSYNGGSNYSYGNGNGGNNGGGVNYYPLAQMVCSDNIYSLENFFYFCPTEMNFYPACGNNVIYMSNTFNAHVVGAPVFGPNVVYMCDTYRDCYLLAGSVNVPSEYNLYVQGDNCFYGCESIQGHAFTGGISGSNLFSQCYNLQGVEISGGIFYEPDAYYMCTNLRDVIYKRRPYRWLNSSSNQMENEDPNINNCFPTDPSELQYANYYNCFQDAGTNEQELNIYCYNEQDYNFLKNSFFNNFFNGGSNVRARVFGNETTPSSMTVNCLWNVYDGNGTWNNYNRQMNVIKRCNSYSTLYDAGPYNVTLYYVN